MGWTQLVAPAAHFWQTPADGFVLYPLDHSFTPWLFPFPLDFFQSMERFHA